jgi:hypothetical protein
MTQSIHDQPPLPLLIGDLHIERVKRQPLLLLVVRCPACHGKRHVHEWPGDVDDAPSHRTPHCTSGRSPFLLSNGGNGYCIAPRPTEANARACTRFAELLRLHACGTARHDHPAAGRGGRRG